MPIRNSSQCFHVRWVIMTKFVLVGPMALVLALSLLAGCGGSSHTNAAVPNPAPLSAGNLNLIFVVSPDLAYQASGDVNPSTANLTNQGLQRSLLMATFLQQQVLGTKNVTGIYALEPMTHLQTAGNYPDMAALETIQQFALLNQITLSSDLVGGTLYTGNNYPDQCIVCVRTRAQRSCHAAAILPDLPGSRFQRPGQATTKPW